MPYDPNEGFSTHTRTHPTGSNLLIPWRSSVPDPLWPSEASDLPVQHFPPGNTLLLPPRRQSAEYVTQLSWFCSARLPDRNATPLYPFCTPPGAFARIVWSHTACHSWRPRSDKSTLLRATIRWAGKQSSSSSTS